MASFEKFAWTTRTTLFSFLLPGRLEVCSKPIEHFVGINARHSKRSTHVRNANLLCVWMPIRLVTNNDTLRVNSVRDQPRIGSAQEFSSMLLLVVLHHVVGNRLHCFLHVSMRLYE